MSEEPKENPVPKGDGENYEHDEARARKMAEAQDPQAIHARKLKVAKSAGHFIPQEVIDEACQKGAEAAEVASENYDRAQVVVQERIVKNGRIMEIFAANAQPGHGYGFDEQTIISPGVAAGIFEAAEVEHPDQANQPKEGYQLASPRGFDLRVRYTNGENPDSPVMLAMVKPVAEGQEPARELFTQYLDAQKPEVARELRDMFSPRMAEGGSAPTSPPPPGDPGRLAAQSK